METLDLPVIWTLIIALSIFMYVVLDGFDIGVGILFPLAGSRENRQAMLRSIVPVWDGNETWLVLAGASLLAAFPTAFSVLLPSVYLPLCVMLIALVARAAAVEFSGNPLARRKRTWHLVFALASLAAALAQGFIVGAFLEGTKVSGSRYTGGGFDWLTPFTVFVSLSVTAGYALLGAAWTVLKSEGDLTVRARIWARRLTFAAMATMVVVSFWMLSFDPQVGQRWGIAWPIINLETLLPLIPIPVAALCLALLLLRALGRGADTAPFFCAAGIFTLTFVGTAISVYPYIVPYRLTVWEAASAPNSQAVLLLGVLVLLPIILTYTGYIYWVFRGKAREEGAFAAPGVGHGAGN